VCAVPEPVMDAKTYKLLLDRAKTSLSADASDAAKKNIEENIERVAAALVLEWLLGEKRFESQSQQTEHWLARFYEELFNDEQPDPTRIYARFNLSLPRSGYLARMLRARHAAQWRSAARKEVKAQLTRHKKAAEQAKSEGQAHIVDFDLSLSAGAADELRVLYDRISDLTNESERPRPPKIKPTFGGSRWFGMPADTLLLILKRIDEEAK
jgi:hypothetical protein